MTQGVAADPKISGETKEEKKAGRRLGLKKELWKIPDSFQLRLSEHVCAHCLKEPREGSRKETKAQGKIS